MTKPNPEPLPRLLDCKQLMAELGVTRGVAESLMRSCDKIVIGRRVFVVRGEIATEIERRRTNPAGFKRHLG